MTLRPWSREEIRDAVDCPKCGAFAGIACRIASDGRPKNHHLRMVAGQKVLNSKARPKIGLNSNRDPFYKTAAWRSLRFEVLVDRGARCECCGVTGHEARLNVDHIRPRSARPDLELVKSNLQVLCANCNIAKGSRNDPAKYDFRLKKGQTND